MADNLSLDEYLARRAKPAPPSLDDYLAGRTAPPLVPTPNDSALRGSLFAASQTTPQTHATGLDLAETTGIPAGFAAENAPEIHRSVLNSGWLASALMRAHPALGKWLAGPDNAAVSIDDFPALAAVARFTEAMLGGAATETERGVAGLATLPVPAAEFVDRRLLNFLRSDANAPGPLTKAVLGPEWPSQVDSEGRFVYPEPFATERDRALAEAHPYGAALGNVGGFITTLGATGLGSAGPAVIERLPVLARMARTAEVSGAAEQAVLAAEGSTLRAILAGFGPRTVATRVAESAATLGIAGAAMEPGTIEARAAAGASGAKAGAIFGAAGPSVAGLPWWLRVLRGGLAGAAAALAGAPMLGGPAPVAGSAIFGGLFEGLFGARAGDYARVGQGMAAGEVVDRLGALARESKLAALRPRSFADALQAIAESHNAPSTVYVPEAQWTTHYQDANESPLDAAREVGAAESYQEALGTGGDVAVPLGEFIARIAKNPKRADLLRDVRFDPKDPTPRQAAAELTAMADDAPVETTAPDTRVREAITAAATAAGRPANEAYANGVLWQGYFNAKAERLGTDAWTEYQKHQVTVGGAEPAPAFEEGPPAAPLAPSERAPVRSRRPRTRFVAADIQAVSDVPKWIRSQGGIASSVHSEIKPGSQEYRGIPLHLRRSAAKGGRTIEAYAADLEGAGYFTDAREAQDWIAAVIANPHGERVPIRLQVERTSDELADLEAQARGFASVEEALAAETPEGKAQIAQDHVADRLEQIGLATAADSMEQAKAIILREVETIAAFDLKPGEVVYRPDKGDVYVVRLDEEGQVTLDDGIDIHLGDTQEIQAVRVGQVEAREYGQAATPGPTFYSELSRQVGALKVPSATGAEWKKVIAGLSTKGVKREEVFWSGVEDWLDATGGKVTKEQVQAFLDAGGVRVEERTLGGVPVWERTDHLIAAIHAAGYEVAFDPDGMVNRVIRSSDRAEFIPAGADGRWLIPETGERLPADVGDHVLGLEAAHQYAAKTTAPQFQQYTLPGGKDYRELLLTLPVVAGQGPPLPTPRQIAALQNAVYVALEQSHVSSAALRKAMDAAPKLHRDNLLDRSNILRDRSTGASRALESGDFGDAEGLVEAARSYWDDLEVYRRAYAAHREASTRRAAGGTERAFRSSHFDEPNILAHVRFDTRTDAEGKRVLFIEEIQSDWAQKGRKAGFAGASGPGDRIREINRRLNEVRTRMDEFNVSDSDSTSLVEEQRRLIDERARLEAAMSRSGPSVPLAPFVTDTKAWTALAVKRMIRYAAENGFDRIAWTTGAQQVERYRDGLRQAVDRIEWTKTEEGVQLVGFKNALSARAPADVYQAALTAVSAYDSLGFDNPRDALDAIRVSPRGWQDRWGGDISATDASRVQDWLDALAEPSRSEVLNTTKKETVLSDAIGKAMADRILESPDQSGVIEGEDITVSDTGMAGYYDRILPQVARDVMKKLGGGVVGEVEIAGAAAVPTEVGFLLGRIVPAGQRWRVVDRETGMFVPDAPAFMSGADAEAWIGERVAPKQPGFDISPAMRERALAGQALFQDRLASITITAAGGTKSYRINLGKDANRSSLAHESFHAFTDMFADEAEGPNATEAVRKDWQTLLDWWGVKSRAEIKDAHHERLARTGEQYLKDGIAPTAALRSLFARFRAWLLGIYGRAQVPGSAMNPEIKAVFDRWFATDAEIRQAEADAGARPIFDTADAAGATPEEFAAYTARAESAGEDARAVALRALMEEHAREGKAWWREKRGDVRAEIERELAADPVYSALHLFRTGKMLDGSEVPEALAGAKLSKAGVEEIKGPLYTLPGVIAAEGGMHPDMAAELLGFRSGDAMLTALQATEARTRVLPRLVAERMRERYGDLLTDGKLPQVAQDAVHGASRAELLAFELKYIGRKLGRPEVEVDRKTMETAARKIVEGKPSGGLSADRYRASELASAGRAREAVGRGDYRTAHDEQLKRLRSFYLYNAAREARHDIEVAGRKFQQLTRPPSQERLGKAQNGSREQMNRLLTRFGIAAPSVQPTIPLREWADGIVANDGSDLVIAPWLMDELRSAPVGKLTVGEVRDLKRAVDNISYLASDKNFIRIGDKRIDAAEARGALVQRAEASRLKRKKLPRDRAAQGRLKKLPDGPRDLHAYLVNRNTDIRALDGFDDAGPWHELVWNPLQRAIRRETEMDAQYADIVWKHVNELPAEIRKGLDSLVDIPELRAIEGDLTGQVTRGWVVHTVLNMGNVEGLQRLTDGNQFTERIQRAIVMKLNAREVQLVQAILDTVGSLYPEINALHERRTGVPLKRVEAVPIETAHGTIPGGYFPLVYDRRLSDVGARQDATTEAGAYDPAARQAYTSHGFTEARVGRLSEPLLLDSVSIVPNHIREVIHDLAFRQYVASTSALLTHPEIKTVLRQRLGPDLAAQFMPWLRAVGNYEVYRRPELMGGFEKRALQLRSNAAAAIIGAKITIIGQNFTNLPIAASLYGPHWITRGLVMSADPRAVRFAWENSPMIRNRVQFADRDLRAVVLDLYGRKDFKAVASRYAFGLMASTDVFTAIPIWLGVYERGLKQTGDPARALEMAEEAIQRVMSSAHPAHLAEAFRSKGAFSFVSMFGNYMNQQYNNFVDVWRRGEKAYIDGDLLRKLPQLAGTAIGMYLSQALLAEWLSGRGKDPDETYGEWVKRRLLLSGLSFVPILNAVGYALETNMRGKKGNLRLSPVQGVAERVIGAAVEVPDITEDPQKVLLDMAEAIGLVTGWPGTVQLRITVEALLDLFENGATENTLHDMTFGRQGRAATPEEKRRKALEAKQRKYRRVAQ